MAAGPLISLALVLGMSAAGGDAGDVAAYPIVLTAVGFVWLGWYLWREPAVDAPVRHGPFATA